MAHLDHETLLNYLEGGLTAEEQGRAAAHLAGPCERCAQQLRLLTAVVESAAADRTVAPPAGVLKRALETARAGEQPARPSARTRVVAALGFDSHRQLSAAAARGATHDRHLLFTAEQVDIDLQIKSDGGQHGVLGQVLTRSGSERAGKVFVSLETGASRPLWIAETDAHGQFTFKQIPPGTYDLVFDLADREVAILGLELEND